MYSDMQMLGEAEPKAQSLITKSHEEFEDHSVFTSGNALAILTLLPDHPELNNMHNSVIRGRTPPPRD
jgi:hypothetical protein